MVMLAKIEKERRGVGGLMHNRVSGEAVVFSWRLLNLLNYRLSYMVTLTIWKFCVKKRFYT